jgi:hypothetical protein
MFAFPSEGSTTMQHMDRASLEQLLGQGLSLGAIGRRCVAIALDRLRGEARKCVLLCSNCHAEVEDGIAAIPVSMASGPSPG